MDTLFLNEQRCSCGKLLLKGIFFDGQLEIKCKKCGTINKMGSIKLADDENHYLLIINNKGAISNISNTASLILGYSHEELIGLNYIKLSPIIPPEITKMFLNSNSVLDQDNYFKFDTTHKNKSGHDIPVTVTIKLYQPTHKERYVLLAAELKKYVIESKIIKDNTIEELESSCDFCFDIDKNGIIQYICPSTEKILGASQDSFIGKSYFDYVPEERRIESKKAFDHFSEKEESYRIKGQTENGFNNKIKYDEICFTPRQNDAGKFVGYRTLVWLNKN